MIVLAIAAWLYYAKTEGDRLAGARRISQAPSVIRLTMTVTHDDGPLRLERYEFDDNNGLSTASYRAEGRKGVAVTVGTKPYETFDIAFLFGKLVQDGIWDLTDKPPRGNTATSYDVSVYQEIEGKHGSRSYTFTDPHYWANAREFNIRLEKNKPLPDLLVLRSNARDKRYEQIVNDFRNFGSETFKRDIAEAQSRAARAS
jgi:hypothetical protein